MATRHKAETNNHNWHLTGVKWCRGPLHPPGGELLPCLPDDPGRSAFWFFQPGTERAGKPLSRCKRCLRFEKGRDPDSEPVSVTAVEGFLDELIGRIGKAEMQRRCGLSQNFYSRVKRRVYKNVYRIQYERIKDVYDFVIAHDERRHPNDIRHGTTERGKTEARRQFRNRVVAGLWWGDTEKTGWDLYLDHIAERNKVTMKEPDRKLWFFTGMEWLPRYGEEMLGADF